VSAVLAVVIGASAGGIDAIRRLLEELPAAPAAPLLVVVHLPPDRPSRLAGALDVRSDVVVREAEDKAPLVAGELLVAPPSYHLLVEDRTRVALSRDEPVHFSRPSIDALFESAAFALRDGAIGVLLTGASVDGAAGLAAIRRVGGHTYVQDPATAASPTMPQAAIDAGAACEVADLPTIARRLSARIAGASA
jgi:two-component system chemotaxis response regulator CheB